MHRLDDPDSLPALLAEYGRLAAQLRDAGPDRAPWLRERVRALDKIIDRLVVALGTTRL